MPSRSPQRYKDPGLRGCDYYWKSIIAYFNESILFHMYLYCFRNLERIESFGKFKNLQRLWLNGNKVTIRDIPLFFLCLF